MKSEYDRLIQSILTDKVLHENEIRVLKDFVEDVYENHSNESIDAEYAKYVKLIIVFYKKNRTRFQKYFRSLDGKIFYFMYLQGSVKIDNRDDWYWFIRDSKQYLFQSALFGCRKALEILFGIYSNSRDEYDSRFVAIVSDALSALDIGNFSYICKQLFNAYTGGFVNWSCSGVAYSLIHPEREKLLDLSFELHSENNLNSIRDLLNSIDIDNVVMDNGTFKNYSLEEKYRNSGQPIFSPEKPTKTYGKCSNEDINKELDKLLILIFRSELDDIRKTIVFEKILLIQKILLSDSSNLSGDEMNKITRLLQDIKFEIETIGPDNTKVILRTIEPGNTKYIFRTIANIQKKVTNMTFTDAITGKYLNDGEHIVLFLNNILDLPEWNFIYFEDDFNANNGMDRIRLTYAHEMFHFIHFNQLQPVADGDYAYDVIIEGLARWFEIEYAKHANLNQAVIDELIRQTDNRSVIAYPYSGACYITPQKRAIYRQNTFSYILQASFVNDIPHFGIKQLLSRTDELKVILKNLE